jgi:predicted AlkP superfamily phosphohydrolase/phosphomutase
VHDTGKYSTAQPAALLAGVEQRFGQYPAREWMYANPWPSAACTRLVGEALSHAVRACSRAAQWLALERFPEWDFFAVASEIHGGMESFWHGADASHPLDAHPSAEAAARALLELHRELDRKVGQLIDVAGDAAIIVFNNGGMGPNRSDVQSMVLLAELLHRNTFRKALLSIPQAWAAAPNSVPILEERDDWATACASCIPDLSGEATALSRIGDVVRRVLLSADRRLKDRPAAALRHLRRTPKFRMGVDWMPGYRYRHNRQLMPAFALPSFSDGRIRINLRGRERFGIVGPSRYEETCTSLETLLRECRAPSTGEPSVASIERASTADPSAIGRSEADLRVEWHNLAVAFEHPRLGLIGPVPFHRIGGHTAPYGGAYVAATGVEPRDRGIGSSFDVAATMVQLLGTNPAVHPSGKSLLITHD